MNAMTQAFAMGLVAGLGFGLLLGIVIGIVLEDSKDWLKLRDRRRNKDE